MASKHGYEEDTVNLWSPLQGPFSYYMTPLLGGRQ